MNSLIEQIQRNVTTGTSSAVAEVKAAFERAKKHNEYNAILSLSEKTSLENAQKIDDQIARGESVGRLAGVPFLAKDNFLTFGSTTTAASKILGNFTAPLQATVIKKLEAEGAICIGKTNLDAFAHGGSTENSAYGVTKNAKDTSRVAGGSSGGSAVAVALDIVPFALGTDTGGSIRQPASFNGVVGMKPTFGAVSRFGVIAMASSTDCIGPIATTIRDIEIIMEVVSGKDERDSTTLPNFFKLNSKTPKEKYKIGVIKECLTDSIDKNVRDTTKQSITMLKQKGYEVEEVSLPTLPYSLPIYYIIVPAEISSNLARYDGVRYGERHTGTSLQDMYMTSRDQGLETENKRRILIGTYVLSSGYYDAYYLQAQKARTLLIRDFEKAFDKYDVLISPTAPTPAFKIGENTHDPIKMYMSDIMTVAASLAGIPAISVPLPVDQDELPVGLQVMAPREKDADLLEFARVFEPKGEKNG